MRFIAIKLTTFHTGKWKDATANCMVVSLGARTMEHAKDHMKRWYPKTTWLITRADTTKNMVYGHQS